jgi:UDP-N-acetylglucosamine acyltransferase
MAVQEPTTKTQVDPLASVDSKAELGAGVRIGPFCVIEPNVTIGDGTTIEAGAIIKSHTRIGRNCRIHAGAILGDLPQDRKFRGEETYLKVGDNVVIREYTTLNRATGEGRATEIGSDTMLMAFCHVGHNCLIGERVTMANQVGVSGHTVIEDNVVLGGITGIHQYVRIGKLSIIGGYSKVVQDVPPFMMADGRPSRVHGLNVIGLRRAGIPAAVRSELKLAYRLLYRDGLNMGHAVERIESDVQPSKERDYLLDFLKRERSGLTGRQLEPH